MLVNPPAVLITDDDPAWREALEQAFGPPQYRPLLASDGCEALEIVRHERIDLLLLDMHMPGLNGLETIRRIREFSERIPCILISAALDDRIRRDALAVRAYSVLSKPVRLGEVRRVVQQALRAVYDWPHACQDDDRDDTHPR
jgi:CheY-like chemotaxis protein